METNKEQQNIVQEDNLVEETKSIEVCISELKELGLNDNEIENLDKMVDAIIDNRLDFIMNNII